MSKFKKLLLEYSEKFNEGFPIFLVMGMNENSIIKILEDSITNNRKYEPEMIEGVIY